MTREYLNREKNPDAMNGGYIPTNEEIREFCGMCDLVDNRRLCASQRQETNTWAGECSTASIGGISAYLVKRETIQIGNRVYTREQVDEMRMEARRQGKKFWEFMLPDLDFPEVKSSN